MPNYSHTGTAMHNPLHLTWTSPLGTSQKYARTLAGDARSSRKVAKPGENEEAEATGRSRVAVGRADKVDDAPNAYTEWERPIDIVLKVESKETTVVRRTTRPYRLRQCGIVHDRSQLRRL